MSKYNIIKRWTAGLLALCVSGTFPGNQAFAGSLSDREEVKIQYDVTQLYQLAQEAVSEEKEADLSFLCDQPGIATDSNATDSNAEKEDKHPYGKYFQDEDGEIYDLDIQQAKLEDQQGDPENQEEIPVRAFLKVNDPVDVDGEMSEFSENTEIFLLMENSGEAPAQYEVSFVGEKEVFLPEITVYPGNEFKSDRLVQKRSSLDGTKLGGIQYPLVFLEDETTAKGFSFQMSQLPMAAMVNKEDYPETFTTQQWAQWDGDKLIHESVHTKDQIAENPGEACGGYVPDYLLEVMCDPQRHYVFYYWAPSDGNDASFVGYIRCDIYQTISNPDVDEDKDKRLVQYYIEGGELPFSSELVTKDSEFMPLNVPTDYEGEQITYWYLEGKEDIHLTDKEIRKIKIEQPSVKYYGVLPEKTQMKAYYYSSPKGTVDFNGKPLTDPNYYKEGDYVTLLSVPEGSSHDNVKFFLGWTTDPGIVSSSEGIVANKKQYDSVISQYGKTFFYPGDKVPVEKKDLKFYALWSKYGIVNDKVVTFLVEDSQMGHFEGEKNEVIFSDIPIGSDWEKMINPLPVPEGKLGYDFSHWEILTPNGYEKIPALPAGNFLIVDHMTFQAVFVPVENKTTKITITKNLTSPATEDVTFLFEVTETREGKSFYTTVTVLAGQTLGTVELMTAEGEYRVREVDVLSYDVVGSDTKPVVDGKVIFENRKTNHGYFTDCAVVVNRVTEDGNGFSFTREHPQNSGTGRNSGNLLSNQPALLPSEKSVICALYYCDDDIRLL